MKRKLQFLFSPFYGSTNGMRIEILDVESRERILSAQLSYEEVGRLMSSQAFEVDDCHVTDNLQRIGKTKERKVEMIEYETSKNKEECIRNVKKACKPLEIDGWVAQVETRFTSQGYSNYPLDVSFERYV